MKALLTSCGRHDLLHNTLRSFNNVRHPAPDIEILIHEDDKMIASEYFKRGMDLEKPNFEGYPVKFTEGRGQHKSIELFLKSNYEKFYLHLEDDWEFKQNYSWIEASLRILESDPMIIKVLARDSSPHPCEHLEILPGHRILIDDYSEMDYIRFGYLMPWENKGITWHGFSWNPGVTRLDLLKEFAPFPKWEQELAKKIHEAGYKVVELARPVYSHIGDGRSTHEL